LLHVIRRWRADVVLLQGARWRSRCRPGMRSCYRGRCAVMEAAGTCSARTLQGCTPSCRRCWKPPTPVLLMSTTLGAINGDAQCWEAAPPFCRTMKRDMAGRQLRSVLPRRRSVREGGAVLQDGDAGGRLRRCKTVMLVGIRGTHVAPARRV
jgi:hypothetical protein